MNEGWQPGVLGDFIELKRGYDLPTRLRTPGRFSIVSSSGVTGTHNESKVAAPGVVTGRYGTIGEVFYLEEEFWPLNTTLYVRDFRGNDPRFIAYFLKTFDYSAYSDKAAVPGVNRNHLHQAKVTIPPLKVQREIAATLAAIDTRIELNRQTVRTLEELAQRLFKSWFVDFDPVRAKMAGHEPAHMPPEIAALFPDKLVDSPLGTIPEGWSVTCVENVAEIIKGRSYKKAEISESDTALVTLKSFHRGGGYRHDGLKPYLGRYKEAQLVRPGDLVVACTDVTQQADVIGQPALVGSTSEFDKLVVSLDVLKIKPNNSVSNEFLYFLFRQKFYRYHILAYVTGTTVLHLAKDGLPSFKFPMAPQAITEAFNSLASQIFDKIRLLHSENCCLSEIRDRLLPKLISGEIRVPEAQESAEEA